MKNDYIAPLSAFHLSMRLGKISLNLPCQSGINLRFWANSSSTLRQTEAVKGFSLAVVKPNLCFFWNVIVIGCSYVYTNKCNTCDTTDMYGCQQVLINPDADLKAILEFICEETRKLSDCGVYLSRQLFFKTNKIPSKFDLHRELKSNPHYQALYSQVAQQCLSTVAESFKSFKGLMREARKGNVNQKPKLPGYRSSY